jgi:phage/plasmid-associated DNA primase
MFKGYAIKYKDCKDEHLEDAQPWVDHIKNIICNGDEKLFKWTMSWLALTIQKPWIKAGVMLMIKSKQGAGKQRMFNPLLEIIGEANSLEVNNMDMLTSRFNSHLAGKVLIVIDEALFGGNIKQRSQLKNLITSYIQNIEMKGKDMISIKDFCNLASLTNNSFSAPVDENQRRFMYWQCLMNGLPAQKHTLKRKRERITKQSPAQMNHTLEL